MIKRANQSEGMATPNRNKRQYNSSPNLSHLEARIDRIEQALDDLPGLVTKTAVLESNISNTKDTLETLDRRITSMESTLRSEINDMEKSIQCDIKGVRSIIWIAFGSVSTVIAIFEGLRIILTGGN